MIAWLVADGRVALAAAAIILIELLLAKRIAGARAAAFAANALAGLGLLGALYAALTDLAPVLILAGLAVSLVGHVANLAMVSAQRRRD